jgi:hypothetical protein
MTRIETTEDFERARERLRQRNSDSLVAFLMSLAMDSGPVGEQVRTFIVGDDVAETERVKGLIEGDAYGVRSGLVSVYCIEAQAG